VQGSVNAEVCGNAWNYYYYRALESNEGADMCKSYSMMVSYLLHTENHYLLGCNPKNSELIVMP